MGLPGYLALWKLPSEKRNVKVLALGGHPMQSATTRALTPHCPVLRHAVQHATTPHLPLASLNFEASRTKVWKV